MLRQSKIPALPPTQPEEVDEEEEEELYQQNPQRPYYCDDHFEPSLAGSHLLRSQEQREQGASCLRPTGQKHSNLPSSRSLACIVLPSTSATNRRFRQASAPDTLTLTSRDTTLAHSNVTGKLSNKKKIHIPGASALSSMGSSLVELATNKRGKVCTVVNSLASLVVFSVRAISSKITLDLKNEFCFLIYLNISCYSMPTWIIRTNRRLQCPATPIWTSWKKRTNIIATGTLRMKTVMRPTTQKNNPQNQKDDGLSKV